MSDEAPVEEQAPKEAWVDPEGIPVQTMFVVALDMDGNWLANPDLSNLVHFQPQRPATISDIQTGAHQALDGIQAMQVAERVISRQREEAGAMMQRMQTQQLLDKMNQKPGANGLIV